MRKSVSPQKNLARRLVLISNRLPVSVVRKGRDWQVVPSAGGLVTALGPVLRNRGGLWIGWPGTTQVGDFKRILAGKETLGFSLAPVSLTDEEQRNFYQGFANEIIWPLFHSLQSLCNYDPGFWKTYLTVNKKFAEVAAKQDLAGNYLWVHDYHLMSVARFLRAAGVKSTLGFFLHIPFPPPEIFQKLPWRHQILQDLLEFDLIGFQTGKHKRNFLRSLRGMFKETVVTGKGAVHRVELEGREVRVGNFPIGIDQNAFAKGAATGEVDALVEELQAGFPGCRLMLGVDRLDYTKGIPYKLQAFRNALKRYPKLRGKLTLVQVVVPSREKISSYHDLKLEIDQLVGGINGELAVPGWTPIHYVFRILRWEELLSYYRASDIAMVTPLEDGMNLVAKEFCAVQDENAGVLILSEFAGSAPQLHSGAILVNPYDVEGVADAIHTAYSLDPDSRRFRMRKLQKIIREQDVFWWVDSFLRAGASNLEEYPTLPGDAGEKADTAWWWELD